MESVYRVLVAFSGHLRPAPRVEDSATNFAETSQIIQAKLISTSAHSLADKNDAGNGHVDTLHEARTELLCCHVQAGPGFTNYRHKFHKNSNFSDSAHLLQQRKQLAMVVGNFPE